MKKAPKNQSFAYVDSFEPRRKKKCQPPAPQFIVKHRDNGEILAVIEAEDALIAYERFERVKLLIRKSFFKPDILLITEHDSSAPCSHAFFSNIFFDVLDASEALKH
jgi:hypothetical protein